MRLGGRKGRESGGSFLAISGKDWAGDVLDESGKSCGDGRILVGMMMVGVFGR